MNLLRQVYLPKAASWLGSVWGLSWGPLAGPDGTGRDKAPGSSRCSASYRVDLGRLGRIWPRLSHRGPSPIFQLEIELPLIRGYVGSNPTLSATPLHHTPVITTSITTHLQRLLGWFGLCQRNHIQDEHAGDVQDPDPVLAVAAGSAPRTLLRIRVA